MRIKLNSIFVDDQARALKFYTEVLGFEKQTDFPAGEYRWITVVAPDEPQGAALVLEPNANPASRGFQESIFRQGIPATAFEVDDVEAEFRRLGGLGVAFTRAPTRQGPVTTAVFADTCGNLIQIYQMG